MTAPAAANLRFGGADVGATTATVTITIAAPGVVTWSSHGLSTGTPVVFTTTGALPTGITSGTTYYAVVVNANTFQIASSVANAIAATPTVITTSDSQSGTHTGTRYNITQRLSMQGVTGVENRLGADLIITGSQGTGNAAGGSIIFQVAPGVSSGSAQNALSTALTINSSLSATFAGQIITSTGTGTSAGVQSSGNLGIRSASNGSIMFYGIGADDVFSMQTSSGTFALRSTASIGFTASAFANTTVDTILLRDAPNTLALRNGNNGQTFRLYGRFTDITNDFERFFINAPTTAGAAVQLGTQKGSAGGTARALEFQTDGVTRLTIQANGNVEAPSFVATSNLFFATTGQISSGRVRYSTPADGQVLLLNGASNNFDRMMFGGTDANFPALKRSSTTLIVRLANDTANAALESASVKTDAPAGGTSGTWKLGVAATVSPTSPNRTIEVDIGGTIYYLHAKTTND